MGRGVRPPWWRTLPYVLLLGFLSLFSAVFSPWGWGAQSGTSLSRSLMPVLAMLVAVGLSVFLFWRHRFPFVAVLVWLGVVTLGERLLGWTA